MCRHAVHATMGEAHVCAVGTIHRLPLVVMHDQLFTWCGFVPRAIFIHMGAWA